MISGCASAPAAEPLSVPPVSWNEEAVACHDRDATAMASMVQNETKLAGSVAILIVDPPITGLWRWTYTGDRYIPISCDTTNVAFRATYEPLPGEPAWGVVLACIDSRVRAEGQGVLEFELSSSDVQFPGNCLPSFRPGDLAPDVRASAQQEFRWEALVIDVPGFGGTNETTPGRAR